MDIRPRPLALLITLFALAAQAGASRADALVTALAGDARPGAAFRVGDTGSLIAFRSGRRGDEYEANDDADRVDPDQTLQLLAAILAVPAGTTPTTSPGTDGSNSVVHSSSSSNPSNPGGDGGGGDGGSHNLAPEPGSLLMALVGSALSGLAVLRRRRRNDS